MTAPAELDGAELLQWADVRNAAPSGRIRHVVEAAELSTPSFLALCRYPGDSEVYLFRVDERWNVLVDTLHESIESAQAQALFEYDEADLTFRPV